MKGCILNTKKLIELLQEADSEGTAEVIQNGAPVITVGIEDGIPWGEDFYSFYKIIDSDPNNIHIKICEKESRVYFINAVSIQNLIYNHPSAQVEYDSDEAYDWWDETVEKRRVSGMKFQAECLRGSKNDSK